MRAEIDSLVTAVVKLIEILAHDAVDEIIVVEDCACRTAHNESLITEELGLAFDRGSTHVPERELLEHVARLLGICLDTI